MLKDTERVLEELLKEKVRVTKRVRRADGISDVDLDVFNVQVVGDYIYIFTGKE